jgi:molybdenum cofactor cytidylyltransferase
MISGIVLAAGAARRMGRQKLFLDLRGRPVLQWALEEALSAELAEVICVVRELEKARQAVFLEHPKLRWVVNRKAREGQSTSVVAGLKAISPLAEAALFILGDQPLIKRELIDGLIDLYRRRSALIVAPAFHGRTRSPVLFHKNMFPDLLKLKGDIGGRGLIRTYREKVAVLEWKDEAPFLDLDVWEDYEEIMKKAP